MPFLYRCGQYDDLACVGSYFLAVKTADSDAPRHLYIGAASTTISHVLVITS